MKEIKIGLKTMNIIRRQFDNTLMARYCRFDTLTIKLMTNRMV
jgi:hypothetical protein